MALSLSESIAADDRQYLARDVARAAGRREEHVGGGEFFGLRRALHLRLRCEFRDLLGRTVRGVEWGPHRTRGHRIDADAPLHEGYCQRGVESMADTLR